ncbi:Ig-like domain-containing protein [Vibrio lentus]|nr:Ig-like domain-containing protein [Vibrio lentus]
MQLLLFSAWDRANRWWIQCKCTRRWHHFIILLSLIHGTNDAPVLAAQTHSVTEDGSLLKGTMIATDVDHGDSQIFSISNAVDGLTFNTDGSYSLIQAMLPINIWQVGRVKL